MMRASKTPKDWLFLRTPRRILRAKMADSKPLPYTYTSLTNPASNIRLLRAVDVAHGRAICIVHAAPVASQSSSYTCLSYTWGDPFGRTHIPDSPVREIVCYGKLLPIGRNLFDALTHLSTIQSLRPNLEAIWIDAVCINQTDEAEKAEQIKMMHKIYSNASSVIIWIGPDPTAGAMVLKMRCAVEPLHAELGTDVAKAEARLEKLRGGGRAEKEELPLILALGVESWLAIRDIVSRAYWQRLWVWQEIMATRNDPVVVCGYEVMTWVELRVASGGLVAFGNTAITRRRMPMHGAQEEMAAHGRITTNSPHQMAWWRDLYRENGAEWMKQKFGLLVVSLNRSLYVCWNERDKMWVSARGCSSPSGTTPSLSTSSMCTFGVRSWAEPRR